ncbi:MAG TPA: electron transport complex subunit RsxA [Candidatus Methylomirabilis sp.]
MGTDLFLIFVSALLVNNILLIRFIGLCPFFGVSSRMETSIGMGFAVVFVMTLSTTISWSIDHFLLRPYNLLFLKTTFFILVIASLVQLVEMFLRKIIPALYKALGIYLPLVTTNCAILWVALYTVERGNNFNLLQSIICSLGIALGFNLAIILFSSLRERIEAAPIPKAFQGAPISFITASLMSLAFLGFVGLFGLQL